MELFALNTPDQLEEAMEFVQKHGGAAAASPIAGNPTWRLIVSREGLFVRTEDIEADTILPTHSTVGMVKNLRDEMPVSAPHGGIVVECRDGDPVSWSATASTAPDCRIRRRNRGHAMMLKVAPGANTPPSSRVAIGPVGWSTTPRSAR